MVRKVAAIIAVILLYGLVTLVANLVHFRFFVVNVVLYDTLLDVLIAGAILGVLYLLVLRRKLPLTGSEFALSGVIGFLLSAFYAISVPTVIDRSLSIYILEKIAQRGGGIRQDGFPAVFRDEYLPEHRLVDIRLTEQLNSGTIRIEDGCVSLTSRGERIVAFSRFYRQNLLPKRREIMGELSDDLTDPFRNSRPAAEYGCTKPN